MRIDNRIFESYTVEFNSPLTDEDWEELEDVDFDHTEHIWFHTKHGKEVHFYKNAIPKEWINKWVVTKFVGAGRVIDSMLDDWEKENEERTNT